MSLKLYRKRGSPNWYIRGTIRGITVDESSGVADRSAAETIRAQREWECIQTSVFGRKAHFCDGHECPSFFARSNKESWKARVIANAKKARGAGQMPQ